MIFKENIFAFLVWIHSWKKLGLTQLVNLRYRIYVAWVFYLALYSLICTKLRSSFIQCIKFYDNFTLPDDTTETETNNGSALKINHPSEIQTVILENPMTKPINVTETFYRLLKIKRKWNEERLITAVSFIHHFTSENNTLLIIRFECGQIHTHKLPGVCQVILTRQSEN